MLRGPLFDRPPPRAVGALWGALAGAVVGLADGARAAWLFGLDGRAVAAAVALAAAVDALLGLGGGAALELLARVAVWGRRATPPLAARLAAYVIAGAPAAAAAAAMVAATAARN